MGTIKLQIPLSGNVFVGAANIEIQKSWPRSVVSIRTQEVVDAIAGVCRRHGAKGVSVRTFACTRHGIECLNGQFLMIIIDFPKNVSIYNNKVIISEGMYTRDISLFDFKKAVQTAFTKYSIPGASQFTFSTFAGLHEGAEITV